MSIQKILRSLLVFNMFAFVLAVFVPSISFANIRPWACLNELPSLQIQSKPCKSYDPSIKKTYSNVCAMTGGQWSRGRVVWERDKSKFKFVPQESCLKGITAIREDPSVRSIGPKVVDAFEGKASVTYDVTKDEFVSAAGRSDGLGAEEKPLLCGTAGNTKRATVLMPCNPDPNGVGYCNYRALNQAKFKGRWWVRYSGKNQTAPQVCRYGVRVSDLQVAANDTGNKHEKMDQIRKTGVTFVTDNAGDLNNEDDLKVSACFSATAGGPGRYRNACEGNDLFVSIAEPTKVLTGRCYIFQVAGVWQAYYIVKGAKTFAAATKRSCDTLDELSVTTYVPASEDES